jgi:hypothetical protein
LDKLLDKAADAGVTVALTPGGWIDELPDLREAKVCVEEFRGAPLGLWPDTANLELAEGIFAEEAAGGLAAVTPGPCDGSEPPAGVRLRDMQESGDPAFPGEGVLDWSRRAALLGSSPIWLVDPPGTLSPARLEEAAAFLDALAPREDYDPFRR